MPDGSFFDLHHLPSWTQYQLASKSLLAALELDNPEETVMLQLTISELSMLSFGLLALTRMFPEFAPIAADLSEKVTDCSVAQEFLRRDTLDSE